MNVIKVIRNPPEHEANVEHLGVRLKECCYLIKSVLFTESGTIGKTHKDVQGVPMRVLRWMPGNVLAASDWTTVCDAEHQPPLRLEDILGPLGCEGLP